MSVQEVGALVFGVVVGWIVYRTLRRQGEAVSLSNIATVIGAVGGASVTTLFHDEAGRLFGWYSIGLGIGFFAYLLLAVTVLRNVSFLGGGGNELGPPL
jgi:ABC-type Co2+ transport system permease subunit